MKSSDSLYIDCPKAIMLYCKDKKELERSEVIISYYSEYKEIYLWFLYAGFILLLSSELFRILYFRKVI